MPSFDVVSKVDMQEVDNAVNQARKEIDQRYDFKGTHNEITLEKDSILILAADDYKLQAVTDILVGKLVRRSVSAKCLDFGTKEAASHNEVRQRAAIIQGVDKEKGKEVTKAIKESKLKVQAQIMDDQVRVPAKRSTTCKRLSACSRGRILGLSCSLLICDPDAGSIINKKRALFTGAFLLQIAGCCDQKKARIPKRRSLSSVTLLTDL